MNQLFNVMKKQEKKWQDLLDNLVNSLNGIPLYCNTPLSFNLKILSVIADAAYVKRVLTFLFEKWKKELPLLSDEGMDIEWYRIKDCLSNYLDTAPYEMEFKSNFPDIVINSFLHTEGEKWREWNKDYAYGGERSLNDYIHGHMSKFLDPVKYSNLWYFTAEDLKKARVHSYRNEIYGYGNENNENWKNLSSQSDNIKRMMISLSIWENYELESCIFTEIEDIINIINKIITLLENPQAAINNEFYNFNKAAADYFVRDYIYGPYNTEGSKIIKKKFKQWYTSYDKDITFDLLKNKLMLEFETLLNSGFLDAFLRDRNCNKIEIDKTYFLFNQYFFDDEGNRKDATCGRYIYTNQMYYGNWIEKTYSFYGFLEMKNYLECEIKQLCPNYCISEAKHKFMFLEKRLTKREMGLSESIKRLMDEIYVHKNKKEPLIKLIKHWFPIFVVMCDKKLGATYGNYSTFISLIDKIAPSSGFRVKLSAISLRRIVGTIYNSPFKMWKYDPDKHGNDEERKRMTYIYMRFTDILHEYGL